MWVQTSMIEAEWLACADPEPMLKFLRGKAGDRKVRLFAVACCWRVWTSLEHEECRDAVRKAESFADGLADRAGMLQAHEKAAAIFSTLHGSDNGPGAGGIHTEVHVPRDSVSRVPLLTPPRSGSTVNGTAFVWLGFRDGDEVSVGVERQGKVLLEPVGVGHGNEADLGKYRVGVLNGTDSGEDDADIGPGKHNAVVYVDGSWPADSDFVLRLEGHETWHQERRLA